jgi:hypothetical protein
MGNLNKNSVAGTLLFLLLMVSVSQTNGQASWKLQKSENGISCYTAITTCSNSQVILLRFTNSNDYPVTVQWNEFFSTSQEPTFKENFRGKKKLLIPPGTTGAESCGDVSKKNFFLPVTEVIPTYAANVRDVEIREFSVSRQ